MLTVLIIMTALVVITHIRSHVRYIRFIGVSVALHCEQL